MGFREEPIELRGPDGLALRGVLTMPAGTTGTQGRACLLLLPAGLKYRTGPHRFYVHLARELASDGAMTLRMDTLGVGESDGELPSAPVQELRDGVEGGRFVRDALAGAAGLRRRYRVRGVVLGGICGGAVTAQLAAAERPDLVAGVLSINTSVGVSTGASSAATTPTPTRLRQNMHAYLSKLRSPAAWGRLLRRESDFSAIGATLSAVVAAPLARIDGFSEREPRASRVFLDSFRFLERAGVPHLMLFGGNDNRWFEFQDLVLDPELGGRRVGAGFRISVIPDANHELHLPEWQNAALDQARAWFRQFAQREVHARA